MKPKATVRTADKSATVKQVEGKEVPLEIIASDIRSIAEGVRKLRAGPLNDRALLLLIQSAAPSTSGRYGSSPLPIKTIKSVFDGIGALEATYLKSSPTKKAGPLK